MARPSKGTYVSQPGLFEFSFHRKRVPVCQIAPPLISKRFGGPSPSTRQRLDGARFCNEVDEMMCFFSVQFGAWLCKFLLLCDGEFQSTFGRRRGSLNVRLCGVFRGLDCECVRCRGYIRRSIVASIREADADGERMQRYAE